MGDERTPSFSSTSEFIRLNFFQVKFNFFLIVGGSILVLKVGALFEIVNREEL